MYVTTTADISNGAEFVPIATGGAKQAQTHLKPGTHIYHEGDDVEWLYQITRGVVRLTRLMRDGRRQVIAFGYPGDIVGFPSGGTHHTECDCLTEAWLQPLRRGDLETGDRNPDLHRSLLQAALREISAMQDHFMMLGRKSAIEKIASFLCTLDDRVGVGNGAQRSVHLPMSRSDIADFLGLTTETVSRTLTQMRKAGVIEVDNIHTVIIRRPGALRGLSGTDAE